MTSIYKKEERDCIYQSEKPFPREEEFLMFDYPKLDFECSVKKWFSSAKRIVVKEGEEIMFKDYFFYNYSPEGFSLKEGVEIPSSCYKILGNFKEVAVFVDSVPHAKGKVTVPTDACEFADWIYKYARKGYKADCWFVSKKGVDECKMFTTNELYRLFTASPSRIE